VKKGGDGPQVRDAVLRLVRARPGQSGIVYCLSRKSAEGTADFLREKGIRALAYHAGLEPAERDRVQDAFRRDEADVVAATIAFGMGIDKSNIRYVIHRDMPRSLEGYYQEIGRAGRDGADADCVLFYSWADVLSLERFLDGLDPEQAFIQRKQIRAMYEFAERQACRHRALVAHFGERAGACGDACDLCSGRDVLGEALRAVSRAAKKRKVPTENLQKSQLSAALEDAADPLEAIYLKLKALRRQIADARHVPPYLVFSDATLQEMAARRPSSPAEMLMINGVGERKLELYGEAFLALLGGSPDP